MAYHMLGTEDPVHAACTFYSGYASVRRLLPAEIEVLHTLVACRLAISVTNGAYSIEQDPNNEYLLQHAQPAWDALRTWWVDTPKDLIQRKFSEYTVMNQYGSVKN